jgi:hypothetical protein
VRHSVVIEAAQLVQRGDGTVDVLLVSVDEPRRVADRCAEHLRRDPCDGQTPSRRVFARAQASGDPIRKMSS